MHKNKQKSKNPSKKERTIVKIIRTLNAGIFPPKIIFSVGFGYDELIKKLSKYNDGWETALKEDKELIDSQKYLALKRTVTIKNKKPVEYYYIIIREQFLFTDSSMCMLAHEVLHICQFFLPSVLEMDREIECVAYTHTHIMQQCLMELREAYK